MTPETIILQTLSRKLDGRTAKFWVAVSAHETGGWTSAIFRENNNLFGMRLPSGNTLAIGANRGHAVFRSLEDSAKDLLMYFDRLKWTRLNYETPADLVAAMKAKRYFEADETAYRKAVEAWYRKLFVK